MNKSADKIKETFIADLKNKLKVSPNETNIREQKK